MRRLGAAERCATKEVTVRTPVRTGLSVVALVAIAASSSLAARHVVRPDGSGDFPNIQAAINAAAHGDTVLLADGTFTGDGNRDIVVPAVGVRIFGESGDYMNCIIDCEGGPGEEHRGFHFTGDVGTGDPWVKDIAVINGYTTSSGAGIWVSGAQPWLEDCAIAWCTVEGSSQYGGGMFISGYSYPYVYSCLMVNNTADCGGGLAIENAGATISGCEIGDNVATDIGGGVCFVGSAMVEIIDSDIISNEAARGGGVRTIESDVVLTSCNISRNEATEHSGGVWLQGGTMYNCTLVENSAPVGGGVYAADGSGAIWRSIVAFSEAGHGVAADNLDNVPYLECCDVYGNAPADVDATCSGLLGLLDNFSQDPELCGREIEDYRLFNTSICLEDNSPCMQLVGRWGIGCDSPVEEASWGRVKALWR
jgi:hypothetical protein